MKIGSVNGNVNPDYSLQRSSEGALPAKESTDVKAIAPVETKVEATKDKADANEQSEFSQEWMKKSVDQANKALAPHNRFVERSVHDVTHTIMYTIKDTVTNEVIAEYPPKKIQDMVAKMWELAGLFVDEKA